MSKSDQPDLSPLREATVQLHELFVSLVDSGFTRLDALRVIGFMLAANEGPKRDG